MSNVLKIKRLVKDVLLPDYSHDGDAAMNMYASENVTLEPGERKQIKTGIAIEIPKGYSVFIWDRSSMSHKHGLKTLGGVIDEGYRGEVMVGMVNLSTEDYEIEKNHKVAQMILQKREEVEIEEVEELSDTARGKGAFGSTGK